MAKGKETLTAREIILLNIILRSELQLIHYNNYKIEPATPTPIENLFVCACVRQKMNGLNSLMFLLLPLLSFLCLISQQTVLAASSFLADEVIQLPGWAPKKLPSRQFSGFVDANKDGTLQMHYWFVESEMENPEDAPLVLWFNGGPGASSLYGMLIELGPLIVSDLSFTGEAFEKTGIPQLMYNEFGWQKVANILALSMPPPVGFSFCSPPGPSAKGDDCGSWNDTSTAEVTYFAIKSWLQRFPQYRKTDMFLTGV